MTLSQCPDLGARVKFKHIDFQTEAKFASDE